MLTGVRIKYCETSLGLALAGATCNTSEQRTQSAGFIKRSIERTLTIIFSSELLTALEARVLRLQPCPRPTAHVSRSDALRDDAFEVHLAGVPKDGRPVAGDCLAHLDAVAQRLVATG